MTTGASLRGKKAYERGEFLASTDERFRPVNLSSAPDGTLYIVDMYRGIIQHRGYITEYLRDQIVSRKLEQPIGHGRIWRVVHDTTRRGRQSGVCRKPRRRALVEALSHPNGWWRDTAQQLLVAAQRQGAVVPLKQLARVGGAAAHPPARAVDARRHGQSGPGQRDARAARSVARRAAVGDPVLGALASRRPTPRCRRP